VTQVDQPNPAGGANLVSTTTYDVVGHVVQTQQIRGAVTQNRTATYNALGQLSASASPEKGAMTFAYNANYTLDYKIDAKNQKIKYIYDDFKRVTQVQKYPTSGGAEDLCQQVNYTWDTHPLGAPYGLNGKGKVVRVQWAQPVGCTANAGGNWTEDYSYNAAGQMTLKGLSPQIGIAGLFSTTNTYDNEGKLTAFTGLNGTYTYGFDSMGRPLSLTKSGDPGPLASGAAYNAAGQMTGLTYGLSGVSWSETNAFNALGQLTRKTIPTVVDFEYTFSATANNGQITTQKDWITGDEQNYQYDALKRLTMAWTTGPAYGLSFGYDGFGNKLTQTVTKGSAPASSITVDANNRITGQTYDANGNMTSGASSTLTYDIDNRVVTAGGLSSENYSYDPGNKRIWKKRALGGGSFAEDVYFYGIGTGRLGIYTKSGGTYTVKSVDVRFAGKLIYTNSAWVATDRLGSIRYRKPAGAGERLDFFPYGEERPSATAQDRDKFATYMRDDTGLDYADQRYFTNTSGRFVTPDPAGDGLNWYAYAGGDPANSNDPSGLGTCVQTGNSVSIDPMGYCPHGFIYDPMSRANVIGQTATTITNQAIYDPAVAWASALLDFPGNSGLSGGGMCGQLFNSPLLIPLESNPIQIVQRYDPSGVLLGTLNGKLQNGLLSGFYLGSGPSGIGPAINARYGATPMGVPAAVLIPGAPSRYAAELILDPFSFSSGADLQVVRDIGDFVGSALPADVVERLGPTLVQAGYLIHELGHIFNVPYIGLGGSRIADDDPANPAISDMNNQLVGSQCITPYFSR
jgi:RHS repeat-associated protein